MPLPEQNGPSEPVYHSVMDLMTAEDIAQQLFLFHMELFEATDELELIFQVCVFASSETSNLGHWKRPILWTCPGQSRYLVEAFQRSAILDHD